MKIGIEATSFYTSHYYVDLKSIAEQRNVDYEKFYKGIGQEKMAVPPPDEDIISMAANAGFQALKNIDKEKIDTVMFATESGIDQSKAAGIYVHHLLELSPHCRIVELKQACYSGTAGLQMAYEHVHLYPKSKVLILASDIARYGLGNAGEPTQGAGAVAIVVSAQPNILELEPNSGYYSEDVMDFWRPNYKNEALVDGKYSVRIYLKALSKAWEDYQNKTGRSFWDQSKYLYHLPFSKMAEKAHKHLAKFLGLSESFEGELYNQIKDSLLYNRITGNSYTASLYIGMMSLLENTFEDLGEKRIGLFSYGSGCVSEFFTGIVQPQYQKHLFAKEHKQMLDSRQELSYKEYADYYSFEIPVDGGDYEIPRHETGLFRFAGSSHHKRIYEKCQ